MTDYWDQPERVDGVRLPEALPDAAPEHLDAMERSGGLAPRSRKSALQRQIGAFARGVKFVRERAAVLDFMELHFWNDAPRDAAQQERQEAAGIVEEWLPWRWPTLRTLDGRFTRHTAGRLEGLTLTPPEAIWLLSLVQAFPFQFWSEPGRLTSLGTLESRPDILRSFCTAELDRSDPVAAALYRFYDIERRPGQAQRNAGDILAAPTATSSDRVGSSEPTAVSPAPGPGEVPPGTLRPAAERRRPVMTPAFRIRRPPSGAGAASRRTGRAGQ